MQVWTDGCCNNRGSGWAAVIPSQKIIFRGEYQGATNQRAELAAIIQAIRFIKQYFPGNMIYVITDSKYAIGCFKEWYSNWMRNGWKNAKGNPVENQDLIMLGLEEGANNYNFQHVGRNSGDPYNQMADYYCKNSQLKPDHQDWKLYFA
jgi:ribonuclease HI